MAQLNLRVGDLSENKQKILDAYKIAVENEASLLKENFKVREVYFQNELTNPFTQFFKILSNRSKKSMKLVEAEINNFKPKQPITCDYL